MISWLRCGGMILAVMLLSACASKMPPKPITLVGGAYNYPIKDRFAATIVGTPKDLQFDLSTSYNQELLNLDIFADRVVPSIFWYNDRLDVDFAWHDGPAPLVFVVAGTGAGSRSTLMQHLQALYVARGFHVISIPSPTFSNFVVSGSTTSMPGRIGDDTRDLYHAMEVAYTKVQSRIEVTKFYLAGYSLGAFEAAFLAKLDEKERFFGFEKVMLMNPPVSLYRSIET